MYFSDILGLFTNSKVSVCSLLACRQVWTDLFKAFPSWETHKIIPIFVHSSTCFRAVGAEGLGGTCPHPPFLADQLTLYHPGRGQICPPHKVLPLRIFRPSYGSSLLVKYETSFMLFYLALKFLKLEKWNITYLPFLVQR